jgi:hypothetical protein
MKHRVTPVSLTNGVPVGGVFDVLVLEKASMVYVPCFTVTVEVKV